jgi:hypothetical protein
MGGRVFSSYREEKLNRTRAEQAIIREVEEFFTGSGESIRRFFECIDGELHLTSGDWALILQLIIGGTTSKDTISSQLCNKFSERLLDTSGRPNPQKIFFLRPTGPEIPVANSLSANFGRIIPFQKLLAAYVRRYMVTEAVAEFSLRKQLRSLTIAPPAKIIPNFPLGMYLMWSTYNERDPSGDPFLPAVSNVAELLAELGLCPDSLPDEVEYIMLTYRLPHGFTTHAPTIIEAFAGAMNVNFHPLGIRILPGSSPPPVPRTFPCPYERDLATGAIRRVSGKKGRPEIVHPVLFANQLAAKPEFRKPTDPVR